jgi:hypothetical protein
MIGLIFGKQRQDFSDVNSWNQTRAFTIGGDSGIIGYKRTPAIGVSVSRDLRLKRQLPRFIKIRLIGTVDAWFLLYSI